MEQQPFIRRVTPTLALTTFCAALLAACGGGGSDSSGATSGSSVSADTATTYAADATVIASDTTSALDTSVLAAEVVVGVQATAASSSSASEIASTPGMQEALAAKPAAVVNVPVVCPGGGSATLTISGGSAASVLNGKLDTGEVYQVVFADCKGAGGAAAVNGTLAMTVEAATSTSLSLAMVATNLGVALPNGTVTLSGSTALQVSSSVDGSGATQLSSHFSAPSITLATRYGARNSSFTLSAVDVTRQSAWVNGLPVSSSMSGTYTLAATLVNGAFSYTVSTQGSVSYSASGVPTSGTWAIELPRDAIGVTVGNATATITVDEGKDGTIDHTYTVPVASLQSNAG